MERFSIFFLSRPVPGVQLWFYPHFCVWFTHRSLVLRLPWSSWVCPCEDQAQRWYDCLNRGTPGSAKCAGKLEAMGVRDMALVRAFSGTWSKAHEGQPWLGFFWHPSASAQEPALSGFLLLSSAGAGMWGERGYNSGSSPCV